METRTVDARSERVQLAHGGGGRASDALVTSVFGRLAAARSPRQDAASLEAGGVRLALSTDAFVVTPAEFPGGDVAKLAVCGTVNDVAVAGARPRWLTAAFVIEEGFPIETLERLAASMQATAERAGVAIVAGDTKVVERGAADGVYIATTGLGEVRSDARVSSDQAAPGDVILLSGTVGDHGMAVMVARAVLPLDPPPLSDCAPLQGLVEAVLDAGGLGVKCLRDPTRGGLAASLNEIARDSGVSMRVDAEAVPVRSNVRQACELLGFDPLQVANEGKIVAVVAPEAADSVLAAMRASEYGAEAAAIGEVLDAGRGRVRVRGAFGAERTLDMPSGELLPRIC